MTLQRLTASVLLICLLSFSPVVIRAGLRQQGTTPANGQPAAGELTNEDVVRLVKAGLGEEMIVLKIKQSKAAFDTSPEALIRLKEAGVSESLLRAMINPAASSAAPTYEPGIYLEENGKLIQLEPTLFMQTKGNPLATGLTYGIKKTKFKAVAPSPHARVQTSQSRPVFHFYFSSGTGGFTSPLMGATGPNEFLLVKLEEKKDRRELVVGEARYGVSMGVNKDAVRELSLEKLGAGRYKVMPQAELTPGEYCFYYATASSGPMGGAGGKLFDFRVAAAR
jgi:hypothetical protein